MKRHLKATVSDPHDGSAAKVLIDEFEELSLMVGIHVVEGENQFPLFYTDAHMRVHTHRHTHHPGTQARMHNVAKIKAMICSLPSYMLLSIKYQVKDCKVSPQ